MRAYERDPEAIERWKHDTYPSIVAAAKRAKAEIYFWDESGFRADAVHGRTWGVKGQTPSGFCGVSWRSANNLPIEARLSVTPNFWEIRSPTIRRVHNPKSNPY